MSALALTVAVLLLLGNAFFVGAEFALISVRRSQLEPAAASNGRVQIVLDALRQLPTMLAACQLGITLCSLGLGAVAEPAVAHLIEDGLHALHVPDGLLHPIAFAIALSIVVFLHMVIGEMVPKNIAIAGPESASVLLVPPLAAFVRLVRPLLVLLNAVGNAILRLLKVEPKDELAASFSPDELATIIEHSRDEGLLDDDEHERLSGALALGARTAHDVMVPLDRLVTVPPSVTADQLEALVVQTGFSRFPVRALEDDLETEAVVEGGMIGFVHVKDILGLTEAQRSMPMTGSNLRRMAHVPMDAPLGEVLTTLQRTRSHLGQVLDSRGAIGVIALEDVVEEFVGEVEDD